MFGLTGMILAVAILWVFFPAWAFSEPKMDDMCRDNRLNPRFKAWIVGFFVLVLSVDLLYYSVCVTNVARTFWS